jgi:hypothetical protein
MARLRSRRTQATNPAGRGLGWTTLRKLRQRTREVDPKGFFPHCSGAATGDEMDVPCPKSNSTDLQKLSLACEELLYRCDKRAQFHSVLAASGGPRVLVGASTTKGTRQTTLHPQSIGVGTCRICRNTSAHLLSFETFLVQIPVATAASKSLLAARRQNCLAGRTFQAAS